MIMNIKSIFSQLPIIYFSQQKLKPYPKMLQEHPLEPNVQHYSQYEVITNLLILLNQQFYRLISIP